jgi:hypothetical protein
VIDPQVVDDADWTDTPAAGRLRAARTWASDAWTRVRVDISCARGDLWLRLVVARHDRLQLHTYVDTVAFDPDRDVVQFLGRRCVVCDEAAGP